jgi:hypothetical protein
MSNVVTVSTTAGLTAALKSAHAGETIELAAGTYSGVVIQNANFATPVTITSVNPNNEAVLSGLKVATSSGLNFTHLELTTVGCTDPYYAFRISGSQNLSFSNLNVQGTIGSDPSTQLMGFYVSKCSNITITHSSFEYMSVAIDANSNTGLTISDNSFQYLNKGGIEIGGISNLNIANNNFTDFLTASGVHADAIQIFTAGTTTPDSNIVITGNLYDRGTGVPAQGIFVQDEVGTLPFNNVTIDNNTIIGGDWNAIFLSNATGTVQIDNNTVASWAGQDVVAGSTTNFVSWIRLGNTNLTGGTFANATVTETGNEAQYFLGPNGKAVTPTASNSLLGAVTDNGAALLSAWENANPSDLAYLSTGLVSILGASSSHVSPYSLHG